MKHLRKAATASMWLMWIGFIAILVVCATSCTNCNANNNPTTKRQEIINNVMHNEKQKVDSIDFEFGLIVTMLYDPYNDRSIIQYDDSDIIDREFVAEISADTLYWEEMAELVVDCDNDILIELINDIELYNQYENLHEWNKAFKIEDSYKLLEIKTEVYGGIEFQYKLIKL